MELKQADSLMCAAVAQKVFPGAVLLVSCEDELIFHHAYGWADVFSRRPMTLDTYFDLASLTKPLATALAVMYLVQYRGLDLDQACVRYCPPFKGTDKARITVRQLLCHRAGLTAWQPYYMHLRRLSPETRQAELRRRLLAEKLQTRPGGQSEYSDVGFMLLQWVLEAFMDRPLVSFVTEILYAPLGLADLYFRFTDREPARQPTAATEWCPWRNRLLVGEVHDDNAAVLGGAAGHAGLFGTARAVWLLLSGLLKADAGHWAHPLFDTQIIRTFFERQKETDWALGFDTPSDKGSSAGQFFSAKSVGHLGYTGTSFWMDRQQGVIAVLLSNRVHPSRYNAKIREFRPRLHDAIMTGIRQKKKEKPTAGSALAKGV